MQHAYILNGHIKNIYCKERQNKEIYQNRNYSFPPKNIYYQFENSKPRNVLIKHTENKEPY